VAAEVAEAVGVVTVVKEEGGVSTTMHDREDVHDMLGGQHDNARRRGRALDVLGWAVQRCGHSSGKEYKKKLA
jgi:hypothetical protein